MPLNFSQCHLAWRLLLVLAQPNLAIRLQAPLHHKGRHRSNLQQFSRQIKCADGFLRFFVLFFTHYCFCLDDSLQLVNSPVEKLELCVAGVLFCAPAAAMMLPEICAKATLFRVLNSGP